MSPISELIKSYFESKKWKYTLESVGDHNEVDIYYVSLNNKHELLHIQIIVDPIREQLHINCFSDHKIANEYLLGALKAINEFNLRSGMVQGCINEDGNQIYSVGIYTGGINVLTDETFRMHLDVVTTVADIEVANTFKKALEYSSTKASKKKRSIFTIFKRKT